MVRLERQRQELSDRITSLQASIFKGSEKLDQFKLLMNWNQDELDQWALGQQQKEEDNQALDKYRYVSGHSHGSTTPAWNKQPCRGTGTCNHAPALPVAQLLPF